MSAERRRSVAFGVVGVVGELMITTGVLLALFVVWQLWWTDVEAEAVHARIVADFEHAAPAPAPDIAPDIAPAQQGPPPAIAVPGDATTFALLRVPRWGEDYVVPISEGVGRKTVLDVKGIGHYPGTAMPGQIGNFALAGHRQTYGRPFFRAPELQPGDALVVESDAAWYVYRVTESLIVSPRAVEVIAPVPGQPAAQPTEAMITLTTCHPLYTTRQRYVVHGVYESWSAKADGYPEALGSEIIARLEKEA